MEEVKGLEQGEDYGAGASNFELKHIFIQRQVTDQGLVSPKVSYSIHLTNSY